MKMKSLLLLALLSAVMNKANGKIPHFLFAGQSNMVGYVTNKAGDRRFDHTMELLLSDNFNVHDLVDHLEAFEFDFDRDENHTPTSVYKFEAQELIRLREEGFLTPSFQQPLSTVQCSFFSLHKKMASSDEAVPLAVDANLSPQANCGFVFGPELMFGHVLDDVHNEPFSIIKVAAGGSEIKDHWSKETGSFWGELVKQIKAIDTETEEWKAIVWFQGENDGFDESNAEGYLDELTDFIANVRQEMHDLDTTTFPQPTDIPVIIVGMGCWPMRDIEFGSIVAQAQRDFVEAAANAVLVKTDDLSCFYHFDDASQLVIGDRIAEALKPLLTFPSSEPSRAPSSTPSTAPSDGPSVQSNSAPSLGPFAWPSLFVVVATGCCIVWLVPLLRRRSTCRLWLLRIHQMVNLPLHPHP